MKLTKVLETCLYSRDLKQTERFYTEILGFELYSKVKDRHVFFRCGSSMLLIFNPDKTMEPGKDIPPHGAYGEGHVAFEVSDEELPRWREYLRKSSVQIEAEVRWPGGGYSLYFRDPAGNSLELATPKTWTPQGKRKG